jgi:hypothetical protein
MVGMSAIAGIGGFVGCTADEFLSVGPAALTVMAVLWAELYGAPAVVGAASADSWRRVAVAAFAMVFVTAFGALIWPNPELTRSVHFRCGIALIGLIVIFPFLLLVLGATGTLVGHGLVRMPRLAHLATYGVVAGGAALFVAGAARPRALPDASEYVASLPIVARVPFNGGSPAELAESLGVKVCDSECTYWMREFSGHCHAHELITVRRDARHDLTVLEINGSHYAFSPDPFSERVIGVRDVADGLRTSGWALAVALVGLGAAFWSMRVARGARRELRRVASAWSGVCERRWVSVETGALYPMPRARPIPDGPVLVEVRHTDDRGVAYRSPAPPLVRVWPGTRQDVQTSIARRATAFDAIACLAVALSCAPLFAAALRGAFG